jgi:peptidyl-prolyl cis-trans isomerase B (cyclophilin B)
MKRRFLLILGVMLLCGIWMMGCGKNESSETGTDRVSGSNNEVNTDEPLTGLHHVEINVKDYGTISVELDADVAPISVTNFVKLANEGFYDGLTFHRIMTGFMIQGGDPEGTGMGGSDETIKGEFSANGVENSISHVRGTISMARSSQYDSASSQFFIVQKDSTYLDGQYAAFGHVTDGMDIVDQICADTPVQDSNGTVSAKDQPVITSVKVID